MKWNYISMSISIVGLFIIYMYKLNKYIHKGEKVRVPSKHEKLSQCCFNVGKSSSHWLNTKTTLAQCLLLAECSWWRKYRLLERYHDDATSRRPHNAGSNLGQRLRRCPRLNQRCLHARRPFVSGWQWARHVYVRGADKWSGSGC